jgi:TolB protein
MLKKLFIITLVLFCTASFAIDLELTQGINSALPIAIESFGSYGEGRQLTQVITNDLNLTGQFRFIEGSFSGRGTESISLWKQAGADSVLTGQVHSVGGDRYEVSFQLLDAAAKGRLLLSKTIEVSAREMRDLAHHISDMVYEKLTGDRGVFSTRIAYIMVQRGRDGSRYSLEIAEIDGSHPQTLVTSNDVIMSPAWSPDARQIAYVSFEKKKAQIFTVSVETGKRRLLTSFSGINGAPSWSPDGRQLAVVLSKGGTPKIYSIDLNAGSLKQMTFGDAIDTEPRFSPDGRSILFTSGRGGSPQVYKLNVADGNVSRMTFEGNYNARASFTPDQKRIIMQHREEGNFSISVQELDTGRVSQLTSAPQDESPSLAPNGRLALYATEQNGKGLIGLISLDGRVNMHLPERQGNVQEPAWSPFLG